MKRFAIILFLFFSCPLFASQSIVVLPFNNESKTQQVYWLGEGFAESLSEEILLKDVYVIQRPERKSSYDALKLPYVGNLSRATMLKLGQNLDASYIVFGKYIVDQKNLKVEAQVIQTSSSKLSSPIQASGSLDQLYIVQAQLKAGLRNYFATQKLQMDEGKPQGPSVPLHAYELYIKGLLEPADQQKTAFFERAIQAHPNYSQASYRLGLALFRSGKHRESNQALQRIGGNGIFLSRVNFLMGLNSYMLQDMSAARKKWQALAESNPTAEVYNNIGVSLVAIQDLDNATSYLTRAVEMDRENPDFRFNLGIAHFEKNQNAEATRFIREAIDLRPSDYQAFYWLGKTLERSGAQESKQIMTYFAERLPSDQKGKFPEQYPDIKQSLRASMTYYSPEEKKYAMEIRSLAYKQRTDYVKTYQGSARKNLEEHPDRAILDIKKGITSAPFDWYLHYMWGQALIQQKDIAAAIPNLKFSLWCLENIDSHVLLAEIYRDGGQFAEAKKHVQYILALDPKHKKAIEIWGKIHNKI